MDILKAFFITLLVIAGAVLLTYLVTLIPFPYGLYVLLGIALFMFVFIALNFIAWSILVIDLLIVSYFVGDVVYRESKKRYWRTYDPMPYNMGS